MASRHTTPEQASRWREAFDITETQAEIVVALIAAKQLGYDGATTVELQQICAADTHHFAELQRLRLVELLGRVECRRACWAATPTAFRRFEQPLPASFRAPDPPTDRITVAEQRTAQRKAEKRKARRARAA